ncbi:hypothetical protein FY528_15685 [Hymenobacter lutimineralis]|uniref:Lipoprotein n=1 Tax=Hymenobacter lutimineralis TaxID=2606448 RepID=A0A5D6UUL6_9BACT|nr:hypothetical protein [Hymenobacter lutimineralis]TYZ07256.1 hypothetical protein FY528_15685 [Hymenobacter lutimineralis]
MNRLCVFLAASLTMCLGGSCSSASNHQPVPPMNPAPTSASASSLPGQPELVCKLTTPELRARQQTVLASLKRQVLHRKELADGFAYEFSGTDAMLTELMTFIQTERQCCGFFRFELAVQDETRTAWLNIKGPEGVKDVIHNELAL